MQIGIFLTTSEIQFFKYIKKRKGFDQHPTLKTSRTRETQISFLPSRKTNSVQVQVRVKYTDRRIILFNRRIAYLMALKGRHITSDTSVFMMITVGLLPSAFLTLFDTLLGSHTVYIIKHDLNLIVK